MVQPDDTAGGTSTRDEIAMNKWYNIIVVNTYLSFYDILTLHRFEVELHTFMTFMIPHLEKLMLLLLLSVDHY